MNPSYKFQRLLGIALVLLAVSPALYADNTAAAAGGGLNLWQMILQGGWAMIPLGLCSCCMFFLIFYAWRETATSKYLPKGTLTRTRQALAAHQIEEATQLLEEQPCVLQRVMSLALEKARPERVDGNRHKVEALMVEALETEENQTGQWIQYLNVVAAVAPMIGLLGTVSGMISAFQTIGQGGMGRPELLAGDIGEALITTATGLVIGIPAMIAYFVLKNRLNSRMLATVQEASRLVDALDLTADVEAGQYVQATSSAGNVPEVSGPGVMFGGQPQES